MYKSEPGLILYSGDELEVEAAGGKPMMNEQPEKANKGITVKDFKVTTIAIPASSTTHFN